MPHQDNEWLYKPCKNPGCNKEVRYRGGQTIPDYCYDCHRQMKTENWHTAVCNDCNKSFEYFDNDRAPDPPSRCPNCHRKFRRINFVKNECANCHHTFTVHKDKANRIYCPDCWLAYCELKAEKKREIETFIQHNQGQKSYIVIRDLGYYQASGQTEHIIFGSSQTHKWTGIFAGANIEYIINAAADLAASTGDGVLEFGTGGHKKIVKYDVNASLVVVFDPNCGDIITTFMIRSGPQKAINKVIKGEWIGDSSMINKEHWESP